MAEWKLEGNAGTNHENDFLGTVDGQPLVLRTSGKEAVRIDTKQNVGIGVSEPRSQLHVKGAIATGSGRMQSPGTISLFAPDGFAWFHIDNGPAGGRPVGRLRISYGGTPGEHEIVSVLQNETIGVGTSSPGAKLHISSDTPYQTPQVKITQTTTMDYARLRFESYGSDPDTGKVPYPVWDLQAGKGVLNIYAEGPGNVMTLTSGGRVGIHNENPSTAFHVNGEATVWNLYLTRGSDIAESFSVVAGTVAVEPGTVMVIDDDNPGALKVAEKAYDKRVAGVVSGARDLKPGLTLCQNESSSSMPHVALTGRVYCKAEAISAAIHPGDLLTTSDIPGHAMKAVDPEAAQGAILGKAMTPLTQRQEQGLVLVLVSLQ